MLLIGLVFLMLSCRKWNLSKVPTVKTQSSTNVKYYSATINGTIIEDGGAEVTDRGFCWSTIPNPKLQSDSSRSVGAGNDSFSIEILNLVDGKKYYYRAYATNAVGTSYGDEIDFSTTKVSPSLLTSPISDISISGASCGGNVTDDGGTPITARGVVWSTSQGPTVSLTTKTTDGNGTGIFKSSINGLKAATTYYVRAYATNSAVTSYGTEYSFTTLQGSLWIGSTYGGGVIAYILNWFDSGYVTGETHGLIAAPSDQSTGIQWGCYGTTVGGTSTLLGTGAANTAIVSATCEAGTAARLCADLVLNGYDDWYLPSRDELNKLYLYRNYIGGFSNSWYQSSSEHFAGYSWYIDFDNGSTGTIGKYFATRVRAVRAF
jgi:hypothetical protein